MIKFHRQSKVGVASRTNNQAGPFVSAKWRPGTGQTLQKKNLYKMKKTQHALWWIHWERQLLVGPFTVQVKVIEQFTRYWHGLLLNTRTLAGGILVLLTSDGFRQLEIDAFPFFVKRLLIQEINFAGVGWLQWQKSIILPRSKNSHPVSGLMFITWPINDVSPNGSLPSANDPVRR